MNTISAIAPSRSFSNGKLAAISALLSLSLPNQALWMRDIPNDPSVFEYIGWSMTKGRIPYVDVWDHKGPLIYFMNELGFRITPNSIFGVGFLEFISLAVTFFLLLKVVSEFAGRNWSLLSMIVAIPCLAASMSGGNMTETWSLPFIAAAIFALWRSSVSGLCFSHAFLVGICIGAVAWLRPNQDTIPILAALVLFLIALVAKDISGAITQAVAVIVGVVLTSVAILFPIWRDHALVAMKNAYLDYNLEYSRALSFPERVKQTYQYFSYVHGFTLILFAWIAIALLVGRMEWRRSAILPSLFSVFLILGIPLELASELISGRNYNHYLVPVIPIAVIVVGYLLRAVFGEEFPRTGAARRIAIVMVMFVVGLDSIHYLVAMQRLVLRSGKSEIAVAQFIRSITGPSDRIVVLGDPRAAYVALHAQRLSEVRFFYQLPIVFRLNPRAPADRAKFVADVEAAPPKVIASTPGYVGGLCAPVADCPSVPAGPVTYESNVLPLMLANFLQANYVRVDKPGFGGLTVYVRVDIARSFHLMSVNQDATAIH